MNREFAIEKGFQIVIFFLMEFWESFLKKEMMSRNMINEKELHPENYNKASSVDKEKDSILSGNNFVFQTVCGDPAGPGDYFKEVVEKSLKIPIVEQRYGRVMKEEVFFQLAIDFCIYFSNKFDEYGEECTDRGSLDFTINWLKDMKKHPEKHKTEWAIWEEVVEYVFTPGDKHMTL